VIDDDTAFEIAHLRRIEPGCEQDEQAKDRSREQPVPKPAPPTAGTCLHLPPAAPGAYPAQLCRTERRNIADVDLTLRMPCVVSSLHAQPYRSPVAEHLAQACCNGRRNGLSLPKDVIELLAGDTEQVCYFHLGLSGCRYDVVKKRAGVGWAAHHR